MSAIRNEGELATPYFLLEIWVRRHEIDIDPETYATLKRKTRRLVRDARGFELRGQEPDDGWRQLRREVLAFTGTRTATLSFDDGREVDVEVWTGPDGHDAAIVLDLPGLDDPDLRPDDAVDPPATTFELALDAYEGDADWGVLLAGLEVRVYRRSSGISQQYLAIDLDTLVELDDEPQWKAFAGIFRAPAFQPDDDGVPLIRRVVDESRRHAAALAEDMRGDVIHAAEALIQGALDHPDNLEALGDRPDRAALHRLYEETLYYLYRVLFVLYAESRDVLPLSAGGPYATTYSVDHLVERARQERDDLPGSYYAHTLQLLFDLLWDGPAEHAERLGFDPVGGELFDPTHTGLLDRCAIDDPYWRAALLSLAVGAPDTARRKLGRRSSFAELGVDQLGSIYEGLLVLEPYLAPGERALVRIDGERRVVEPEQADGHELIRALSDGDFALESASGRRKGSGSFYTPAEITDYLTRAALDPLVEQILAATDDPREAERRILDLKVCDPAMGSGAFAVQATRVLATAVARARARHRGGRATAGMIHHAKREVVRRCIYGVDLNPLAVALAKVSLWLETLEPGRPLSFLDAHLRCGDSLVGVSFDAADGTLRTDELARWPANAVNGLKKYLRAEAGEAGELVLERLKSRKGPRKAIQAKLPGIDLAAVEQALHDIATQRTELLEPDNGGETLQLTFEAAEAFEQLESDETSLRNRLRRAADFWCAQWFWRGEHAVGDETGPVVPPGIGDFEQILGAILAGDDLPPGLDRIRREAEHTAHERRFFHWALEFPEVMVEDGGFDAIIGNPPWNTLSPDVKEFFSTFDPDTFRKGVPKRAQDARKDELRGFADIDAAWRTEARFLHQLSYYAKPEAERFDWYAPDGQLRKGDSNVFRLFVERGYKLLRPGGRLAQVLPDSFYVSSPATGLRQRLLTEGRLERCYVFENRRAIFPIHRSIKVVLLTVEHGTGPVDRFNAVFFTGTDALGEPRAISLDELPAVLADLDDEAATLSVEQVRALAPETWSFPELQTDLDAEIAAQIAASLPALNLDEHGWNLRYCRELDADKDAWRFTSAAELESRGATRQGLHWVDPDGVEWWPLVEGTHIYHLEFPMEGKEPTYWVNGEEVAAITGRKNPDGTSTMNHYRPGWRKVARNTDERTSVGVVVPPRTTCKDSVYTVWGGSVDVQTSLMLATLWSSFAFDYLVRFSGRSNLMYSAMDSIPAPSVEKLIQVVPTAAEIVGNAEEFHALWANVRSGDPCPELGAWEVAQRRASLDAEVALAYGLSLEQYVAVLSTFPGMDRVQPMLPGEPKSFITRDLALLAYCQATDTDPPDVAKLLRSVGVRVAEPQPDYRRLDLRVEAARELGAIPYRPTPQGGKPPEDPWVVAELRKTLSDDPATCAELAERLDRDDKQIRVLLDTLVGAGEAHRDGRGKTARYYVVEG